MDDINIAKFTGMNNITPIFYSDKGVVTPRVVLNADINTAGEAFKRDGFNLFLSLPGAHSLYGCESCMLCVANNVLKDISTGLPTDVCTIPGPEDTSINYLLVEGLIYLSNAYWTGIYNPATGIVSDWGITLPAGPVLIAAAGGLPSGTYHVTFTSGTNNDISGNGPITSITLSEPGGITLLSRPSNTLVWATDKDGYIFTMVGDVDTIVELPTIEPLPSFLCSPPPNMNCLAHAFGRIWGADNKTLIYSEPYHPAWFKPTTNMFKFDSVITLIAPTTTGIFVGMEDSTIFLSGTEPAKMSQVRAGAGSIPGTLTYCNNLPELGDILGTPEKGYVDVPVWRTKEGIVAGNITGRLFNLTKHKVNLGVPSKGASLYRQKKGEFQFLTSSIISNHGEAKTTDILTTGSMQTNNVFNSPNTSGIGVAEEVSCDHKRSGVLI